MLVLFFQNMGENEGELEANKPVGTENGLYCSYLFLYDCQRWDILCDHPRQVGSGLV